MLVIIRFIIVFLLCYVHRVNAMLFNALTIFKAHYDEKFTKVGAVHFINTGFTEGSQMNALRELCVQARSLSLVF